MEQKFKLEDLPQLASEILEGITKLQEMMINQNNYNTQVKYMNVKEAADYLGISHHTLYTKVHKNEITFMKPGNKLYFTQEHLESYIEGSVHKGRLHIKDRADLKLGTKY